MSGAESGDKEIEAAREEHIANCVQKMKKRRGLAKKRRTGTAGIETPETGGSLLFSQMKSEDWIKYMHTNTNAYNRPTLNTREI